MIDKLDKKIKVEISVSSVIKIILIILALLFLYYIRDILLILFIAIILASAFDPAVDYLERKKIPRLAGIILIYLIFLSLIGVSIFLIIPPVINQISQLAADFPYFWAKVTALFSVLSDFSARYGLESSIQNGLNNIAMTITGNYETGLFSFIGGVFGVIFTAFVVLVLTLYLTIQESSIKKTLKFLVPIKYLPYLTRLFGHIQAKIGLWLRGQIILSGIIGIMVYIGLNILGFFGFNTEYALVLALLAATLEFIPYVGPALAAVPAIFLALSGNYLAGLTTLGLYIIIQVLENNLIVPKVMQKAIGLNPIITITAVLIGVKTAGPVGVLLAVPTATAIMAVFEALTEESKTES